jgi:hypothetical protein
MLVQPKLPSNSRPALPRFVYPLGVLLQRDDGPFEETNNYAVVLDVISVDHPVWLVYNRNPYDVEACEPVAADPVKMPAVFPIVGAANFDTAQAVAKLKAWSVNPSFPTLTNFKKLVNATKTQGAVMSSTVWMDDLSKALPSTTGTVATTTEG